MPAGIRATVSFAAPVGCPLAAVSAAAGTAVDRAATSVPPPETASVTDFAVGAVEGFDPETDVDADLTPLFSHGSTEWYRVAHGGYDCPCVLLGRHGCPVVRSVAREGGLTLVFHAADYDELQRAIGDLRERFPGADIERFVRSPATERSRDAVLVDRGKLTDRQLEVLETAREMGYFERPRRANATEVAAELDITASTLREHLAAAERKILDDLL